MEARPLNRGEIERLISERAEVLRANFGISALYLFGSFSRDSASADSDIDMLVEFADRPSFDNYFGLKFELEKLLGRSVDLATKAMVAGELTLRITPDLRRVA